MISRWIRTWYGAFLEPFLQLLARLGITANMLTVASLGVVIVAGVFFAFGQTVLGAWILLLGGFLDGIDGALAHVTHLESPFGGFLDSICDHCGDFAVYLGLLLLALQNNSPVDIILIFIASFASVFGSQVRSRAGMLGLDTKTIGMFTRAERNLVLIVGILIGKMTLALWVLAIFNSFSALQRIIYAIRASRHNNGVPI
ncbi:MAG TPA: CDP-alcohol phosphatidyltransferase family protein [Anaerolineales bacterium]|nr:CDP-alcohol phosphatidyltransferase family protein [Anaerolineales bacterium]